ncbi:Stb5p NDAI_0C03450 [Naumovozyma dairenensis CBS 421]|uniref:Zn(2)-C6 fungal-type domain-containing protein n=1 Tax=Naumovozyma dairenensis (strain ATCC 10597 / BCRC 20456 / CBS 421 / NBRC 0211 / NRRL Y-12639) TaxID=1071378 RepID=G0W894_NAUDC|nr:hypothetical protein NDAI_0C03450 [Naumovozyma dairenensis CBS 421]CCD24005.1 hypothetical protein NDAI_0C03450 [Naumovozyma dairenensis CBS 421]
MYDAQQQHRSEPYSCSRCRRLKKKCLKEVPTCSNCMKANKECVYLGRAPRRTKKEILAAALRGEYVPNKRHKSEQHVPGIDDVNSTISNQGSNNVSAGSSASQLNTSLGPPTPNFYVPINDAQRIPSPTLNSIRKLDGMDDTSPRILTSTQGASEGFNSLISALSSSDTTENTPPSYPPPQNNLMNNNNERDHQMMTSLPPILNESENPTNPMGMSLTPPATNLPVSSNQLSSKHSSLTPILSQIQEQDETFKQQITTNELNYEFKGMKDINTLSTSLTPGPTRAMSIPIHSSALEMETIGSVFKGGRTTSWLHHDGTYKPIGRSLLDRFIAAYFKHNHRLFPMIDKIAFLNDVSKISDFESLEKNIDTGSEYNILIFKIYMIMAIGCTTLRRAGMLNVEEEDLSEHLSYLAMKKFSYVIQLQNIETVRCLLLLGIYSFFEPRGSSSWTISGLIMRLTIALGLNKALTPKKMKLLSAIEMEARNRVFWSAYCFERLVSTSLGRFSAIDDDEITIGLPRPLYDGEKDEIEVTRTMIELRKIAGRIYKQVHSVSVSRQNLSIEQKNKIIEGLSTELDGIYEKESKKMQLHNSKRLAEKDQIKNQICNAISYHNSDNWLTMRYAQLQILLFRPSTLIPKPSIESLTKLGECCLLAWRHTYLLYTKKLLPLNWITLFRTLTICNTILYCLCQWSIDLIESKIEIQQCVEILQHFGEKWIFAKRCADVFQNMSNTILEISLSHGKVPNMDKLTRELFGASDAYQDILDENNVDVSWVDKLM